MALRRRTLLTTAAAVPLAATAGCTDRFADETNARDSPAYARWVPATSPGTEGTYFVYLEWSGTGDLEALGDVPGGDTLFGMASLGIMITGYSNAILESYVFEDTPGGGGATTDVETSNPATGRDLGTIETSLLCGAAVILEGEFDLNTVEAAASDEGFERAGTHQGSRIYEGRSFDRDLAFAARADALVFGSHGLLSFGPHDAAQNADVTVRSIVERSLDVKAGDRQRMADRSNDAEWAVTSAGHGQIALGAWGQFAEGSPFNDLIEASRFGNAAGATAVPIPQPTGEVYSLSPEKPAPSGNMAAAYPDGSVPDRETVAAAVGDRAHEQDIEIDDGRVSVSATWHVPTGTES